MFLCVPVSSCFLSGWMSWKHTWGVEPEVCVYWHVFAFTKAKEETGRAVHALGSLSELQKRRAFSQSDWLLACS
eukprot:758541-Pelagomonas_calceolata.AAC.1